MSALAYFRRAARVRPTRLQAVIGVLAAVLAVGVHLSALTARSAVSVSIETAVVAVTGLIAGWLGSAVLLLFLTVVTFATAATLAAAFMFIGMEFSVAAGCVLGVQTIRRIVAGSHERRRLRQRVLLHQRRLATVRHHVSRLRRAVRIRERALRSREEELARARAGHASALAELKRARHLVDAARRSGGHFVAMMSHEIRTPLHGLMATIDMLRDEPLSVEGRHRIGIARVSARSLLNIANDILDLSRIEAGAFPLDHKPFSLAAVLREAVDEARARAESLGLELRASSSGPLPRSFIGDPVRIKQILANLISNGLKFTAAGGVNIHARYDGRRIAVDVVDSGEGIPHDKRDVIFEPFVQVESKVAGRAGGAGLGLPISRHLAQAMGGSLILVSSGPSGSTFRVMLTLEESVEEPLEDQSQRILRNPPGRILVVEDHPANQYVAKSLLESLDCTVSIAGNGAEALELLGKQTFDLVLTDCQLPGRLDGYETTRRMRSVLHRYIPVIAITANAMVDDRQRCLEAGMDDFLTKPFTKAALSDLLCKWLVPGAGAVPDGPSSERVAELPVLATAVFEELWQSLQWRLSPLRKIYESFLAVAHETLDILHRAAATGEASVLDQRLHTLLGSAGMVGARQVERVALGLQAAVKAERRAELESGRVLLAEAVRRFAAELERRLDALGR